jgi:hypothetical protein
MRLFPTIIWVFYLLPGLVFAASDPADSLRVPNPTGIAEVDSTLELASRQEAWADWGKAPTSVKQLRPQFLSLPGELVTVSGVVHATDGEGLVSVQDWTGGIIVRIPPGTGAKVGDRVRVRGTVRVRVEDQALVLHGEKFEVLQSPSMPLPVELTLEQIDGGAAYPGLLVATRGTLQQDADGALSLRDGLRNVRIGNSSAKDDLGDHLGHPVIVMGTVTGGPSSPIIVLRSSRRVLLAKTQDTFVVAPDGSGDYPTIQDAIIAASNGTTIELLDGTYTGPGNRDIDFLGKAITVKSQSGDAENCIVNCENMGRGFLFQNGEAGDSILENVTVTHGTALLDIASLAGGGLLVRINSAPTIRACVFRDNIAGYGGGVGVGSDGANFDGCKFESNTAQVEGGGAYCNTATVAFSDCIFLSNYAPNGGGVLVLNAAITFEGCTLYGNAADGTFAGVVSTWYDSNLSLFNSIMAYNNTSALSARNAPSPEIQCCNIAENSGGDWVGPIDGQDGINGNIWALPRFCDPENGDFSLGSNSPCAPNEYSDCGLIGAFPVGCGIVESGAMFIVRPDGTGDVPSIQEAIDQVPLGGEVILADGVFSGPGNMDLEFSTREITLRSQSGDPTACIIDCQQTGRGLLIEGGVSFLTRIEGITIRNGISDSGGGAYFHRASPLIKNCRFENCYAMTRGGAVCCYYGQPIFEDCVFWANHTDLRGGGLFFFGAQPILNNCTLFGNSANEWAGGIWSNWSDMVMWNSIVAGSTAGDGVHYNEGGVPQLFCTDIFGNAEGDWGPAIADQFGINGNFSADPFFCDPQNGDFSLESGSPCLTGVDGSCGLIGSSGQGCGSPSIALPYAENFDDGQADQFEVHSGPWVVVDGAYFCSNAEPGVKYTSTVGAADWADYSFDVDIKTTGALIEEILVRYTSPGDFYLFTVRPDPYNDAFLHKWTAGVETMVLQVDAPVHQNETFHHMRVEAVGSRITAYFDGTELFSYVDENEPHLAGKVGVVSFANTAVGYQEAWFDNVLVEEFSGDVAAYLQIDPSGTDPVTCGETATLTMTYDPGTDITPIKGYSIRVVADEQVSFSPGDFAVHTVPPGEQVFFQVLENGPNDCTVDYAILGSSAPGITAPADLFTLTVHALTDGQATVGMASAEFRDLANQTVTVDYESTSSVWVDCGPPDTVTELMVIGGHESIDLVWQDPADADLAEVRVYRGCWQVAPAESAYPGYGQAPGNSVPDQFADYEQYEASFQWVSVATVPGGTGQWQDPIASRGIYFYQVFAVDTAGNVSAPLPESPAALNYVLGDVAEPFDGLVGISDLSVLGDSYGVSCGAEFYNGEVDVGPTSDGSPSGLPQPDCLVGFDDLMIFGFNFGGFKSRVPALPDSAEPTLSWQRIDEVTWALLLVEPCPALKGLHLVAPGLSNPATRVVRGPLLDRQGSQVFLQKSPGDQLDVGLVLLGGHQGFQGVGELMRLVLPEPNDQADLVVEARGIDNSDLDVRWTQDSPAALPRNYSLGANYPNPFNPSTTIAFSLPEPQIVQLVIFGVDGKKVRSLVSGPQQPGFHQVRWDGQDDQGRQVSSGVYFCRIEAGKFVETRKMVLTK